MFQKPSELFQHSGKNMLLSKYAWQFSIWQPVILSANNKIEFVEAISKQKY
eukprot:TRINITY_DN7416_c0_g1_i1.p2 TRINITY_DN7416_c0_g1~~TRINITY_DN7416_c0_g1_i1.p2  ORF type:complete len:51 (+),score=4.04 TRINITY_DN7416_c0_g1_i1:179-331(+)